MTNKLITDVSGLPDKLLKIEEELVGKLETITEKELKFKNLEEKINYYINIKDKVINLNIGGKKFQTKLSTLINKGSLILRLIKITFLLV